MTNISAGGDAPRDPVEVRPGVWLVDVVEHGGAVYLPGDIIDTQLVPPAWPAVEGRAAA